MLRSTSAMQPRVVRGMSKTPVVGVPAPRVLKSSWASRPDTRVHAAPPPASGTVPQTKRQVMADKWWNKGALPNMKDVGTVQELVDELALAGEKLVIVEFFAPWCGACKALYPKICKILAEHPDDVLFLKVSFEDNKEMCKTMGVKVLPFFHFYRGAEGKVDAFSCTVSKIQRLRDAIEEYTTPFCNLIEFEGVPEFPDIKPSATTNNVVPNHDKVTNLEWNE